VNLVNVWSVQIRGSNCHVGFKICKYEDLYRRTISQVTAIGDRKHSRALDWRSARWSAARDWDTIVTRNTIPFTFFLQVLDRTFEDLRLYNGRQRYYASLSYYPVWALNDLLGINGDDKQYVIVRVCRF